MTEIVIRAALIGGAFIAWGYWAFTIGRIEGEMHAARTIRYWLESAFDNAGPIVREIERTFIQDRWQK